MKLELNSKKIYRLPVLKELRRLSSNFSNTLLKATRFKIVKDMGGRFYGIEV